MARTPEDMTLHLVFPMPAIQLKFLNHFKYSSLVPPVGQQHPPDWECDVYTTYPSVPEDDVAVPPEVLKSLKADLQEELSEAFKALGIEAEWELTDFWYNSYHEGQGQEAHDHLGGNGITHWCGVYYNKDSSPTIFERPDCLYRCHAHPAMGESHLGYLFERNWTPQVAEGDILLFPPYVRHGVPPLPKGGSRLTFSFNMRFL